MFRFPNWSAIISSDPPVFSAYSTANFSTYGATDIKTYTSKWSAYGTANQSTNRSTYRPANQPTNWSTNRPTNQSADQPAN